jgi:hypothetical protein
VVLVSSLWRGDVSGSRADRCAGQATNQRSRPATSKAADASTCGSTDKTSPNSALTGIVRVGTGAQSESNAQYSKPQNRVRGHDTLGVVARSLYGGHLIDVNTVRYGNISLARPLAVAAATSFSVTSAALIT